MTERITITRLTVNDSFRVAAALLAINGALTVEELKRAGARIGATAFTEFDKKVLRGLYTKKMQKLAHGAGQSTDTVV